MVMKPIARLSAKVPKLGTVSAMCKKGQHRRCYKLTCPCECGHKPAAKGSENMRGHT